jgi:diguanylate cyclase (GGDEF)-like protein
MGTAGGRTKGFSGEGQRVQRGPIAFRRRVIGPRLKYKVTQLRTPEAPMALTTSRPRARTTGRSRALTIAFGAIGLAVAFHALHALFGVGHPGLDEFADRWVYTAAEVLATGVCAARVAARGEDRGAWLLITVSLLTWTAGDVLSTFWLQGDPSSSYGWIDDVLYLSYYPATYVALLLLMRSHFRHVGAGVWLDGVVVGLTTAAVGADLVFADVLRSSNGGTFEGAVNLAYPLSDFLLLVFVALGFTLSARRPGRQWVALGLGIFLSACADMIFAYEEAHGSYVTGGILDTMWPAAMAMIAWAAWLRPARVGSVGVDRRYTVALPAVFGVGALALLVSATAHPLTRVSVGLATGALLAAGLRAVMTYRENVQMLRRHREESATDVLTGLGNRRRLVDALEGALEGRPGGRDWTLAFFDLNGFKQYNDSFGHLAGDALLKRLGLALEKAVAGEGEAYRLGGDEFCVLVVGAVERGDPVMERARQALRDSGGGFEVTTACGLVVLPEEASTVSEALGLADGRMYADKRGRGPAASQAQSVLLQVALERDRALGEHVSDVSVLAVAVGRRLGLAGHELEELERAAELHDVGKLAISDDILQKPGPLNEREMALMRRHTLIGERILNVAPSLRAVGRLVRASHERWDGKGYPDGLLGARTPLGARIIAACDAYDAMVSERPYRHPRSQGEAIEELRRHSGSQFDPQVVEALCEELRASGGLGEVAPPMVSAERFRAARVLAA